MWMLTVHHTARHIGEEKPFQDSLVGLCSHQRLDQALETLSQHVERSRGGEIVVTMNVVGIAEIPDVPIRLLEANGVILLDRWVIET